MTHPQLLDLEDGWAEPRAGRHAEVTRGILRHLFGPPEERTFAVRLWNRSLERPADGTASRFTLLLRWPGALRRMFLPPSELALAEAFLRDDFDVEGDLEAAVGVADELGGRLRSPAFVARLLPRLLSLPARVRDREAPPALRRRPRLLALPHSRRRDAAAVRFHYDVGNAFYALWLDRRMQYSAGYFPTGRESLDAAQTLKLEHICRKLRLRPGERLLDIGCGWGGLLEYAAERYGVRGLGITLSEPQGQLTRSRIAEAGLAHLCRVEVRDYRDLPAGATFDKIVSVGMIEHVGRSRLREYFTGAFRLLEPGGLFLNSGIVAAVPEVDGRTRRLWGGGSFIERYVFPDGDLVPLADVLGAAQSAGFETRTVENLREHYAMTLRHWVRRLEACRQEAARMAGEATYRVWRLYMAASAQAFTVGRLGLAQSLLCRPESAGRAGIPLT